MAKKKIPAAAGAPSSTDGEDESMRPPVEAPPSRIDTLNTTPSRSLSDLADPTVRKSTQPAPVFANRKDQNRKNLIESPERPKRTLESRAELILPAEPIPPAEPIFQVDPIFQMEPKMTTWIS